MLYPESARAVAATAANIPVWTDGFDSDAARADAHALSAGEPREDVAEVRRLANRCGLAVLSDDYRRAPEHRFPAVLDDVSTGVRWLERNGPGQGLDGMQEVNEGVLEVVGPEATVMSIGSPQPLVFGRRENTIYHQMFLAGLYEYLDDTWPGGLEGLAADVEADRPTLITLDHPHWYDFITPVLGRHYEEVGTAYLMTWYLDTSVGGAKLERLRDTVDADLPDTGE